MFDDLPSEPLYDVPERCGAYWLTRMAPATILLALLIWLAI